MTRTLIFILAGAAVSVLGGCASYEPLTLPGRAQLVDRIQDIRHTLPADASGAGSRVIDVGRPLGATEVGLLAILNAPELDAEAGQQQLAEANVVQSALLPNPAVSLGYAALLGGPGTTGAFTASLTQDIASLVTYRHRVEAAHAQESQVNADQLWKEWQVAQKAQLLAVDLYWGERALDSSREELARVSKTADAVRSAVDAGNMTLADLAPLLDSKATTGQTVAALSQTQSANWQSLDALLGMRPEVRFPLAEPRLPELPADLGPLIESLPTRRPDLIALQLGYRSADENFRAAILGQFPAFSLGGSWASDTSDVRSGGPLVTFDLPIFNRNQGQVAQTRATRLLLREQYQQQLDDTVGTILGLQMRRRQFAGMLAAAGQEVISARALVNAASAARGEGNIDQRVLADYETTALHRTTEAFDLERGLDEARVALALELGLGLPSVRIAPLDRPR